MNRGFEEIILLLQTIGKYIGYNVDNYIYRKGKLLQIHFQEEKSNNNNLFLPIPLTKIDEIHTFNEGVERLLKLIHELHISITNKLKIDDKLLYTYFYNLTNFV